MKRISIVLLLLVFSVAAARAADLTKSRVELLCHRTANEDVPENTLESLQQAALLGCDVVEIDLRRTLDGEIVLNHDGVLERLTDGTGDVESSYYGDLRLRDAGGWMGERFDGLRIPLFEDALRMARQRNIRLILDMKDKGMGAEVLEILRREGMLQRVQFNDEWSDVKKLYPPATDAGAGTAWVQPGVTAEQVKAFHRVGKRVIANFSANEYEMDIAAMKAAVAAGVDGINVDYPRLGADAVGRPVGGKLAALAAKAEMGASSSRAEAILELSLYRGFALRDEFAHWLADPDNHVSRAAAVALVTARPRTPLAVFGVALQSHNADARANAAWALGMLGAPASTFLPLLHDKSSQVLVESLLALSHVAGEAGPRELLPFLRNADSSVRGAAALALARHQPGLAAKAIPEQLQVEMKTARIAYEDYVRRGKPQLTQAEIKTIMGYYRCQMEMMRAISMLKGPETTRALEEQAFRAGEDFSQMNGVVAAFQLWDRIAADPEPAVRELSASDVKVADKAEWMLVQAGPGVLPEVRGALDSENQMVRARAIRIVAWRGDTGSLDTLKHIRATAPENAKLANWAIEKIESLHPAL
ncbi:MAG: glycerophosphodiester phosphodiesterase family protein [Acidobacteriaceae bacterium]